MEKKRCFVISPIGSEGSQIREHADDVFDFIIKPALEKRNIDVIRSDHLQEPGKITEQMFREILKDDFCIAVLTGHNPNVFYELAIAHAFSQPVIVLLAKGEELPFDIRELRCIHYDLKPRSLITTHEYENQIIEFIDVLEERKWIKLPFFLNTINQNDSSEHINSFPFYRDGNEFSGAQGSEKWLQLIKQSEKIFEIMGVHLNPWRGREFANLLVKKAKDGCAIRILLIDPDNPGLPEMINEKLTEVTLKMTKSDIRDSIEYYSDLAKQDPNISVRLIRHGLLHCQTTRTDSVAMYLPFFYSYRRRNCPVWQCGVESVLYNLVTNEFNNLWNQDKESVY